MDKNKDLWLNIYTFLLLPFCVIINCINLYKRIKYFNAYSNSVSIMLLIFAIISIIYYSITFYFAKDRRRIGYNLLLVSVGYSVVVASFDQVVATYLDQGTKFYLMFIVYGFLFTAFWGFPNYLYIIKRKCFFETKKIDDETKAKIKEKLMEAYKNNSKQKKNVKKVTKEK